MKLCKILLIVGTAAALGAQTPPDFSGVFYPIAPFGRFREATPAAAANRPPGPPPRPTASAPLSDGSRGRTPDEPSLTPEYLAKWEAISKTRIAGSSEYDLTAKCLPPGMPAMMSMAYGMEVMQTKDKITFFSELNDALRRVYLDGRKPSQKVLDDPTYAGYSTGHWEGDTLVVDTKNFTSRTAFRGSSENLHVVERFKLQADDRILYQFTVEDPSTWGTAWSGELPMTRIDGPLFEYACHEGNYGIRNNLSGARAEEKAAQAAGK